MKKFWILSLVALASTVLFYSCDTEVHLNAPYQSTTVLYGLLDPGADTQFVKITKTFLGDGNFYDYALIRDSSEYKWEEFNSIVVEEYAAGNPNPVATHTLNPIVIHNKNINGVWYGPEQTVYYFPTPSGLNGTHTYKIVVDFVSRTDVNATTNVIPATTTQFQSPQVNLGLSLAYTNTVTGAIQYRDNVNLRWSPIENAEIYDLTLRFHYTELLYSDDALTQLVSTTPMYIDYKIGTYNASDLTANSGFLNVEFNAESFFASLGSQIATNTHIRRVVGTYDGSKTRSFDLLMGLANDELKTYINVNSPVTGVIQERPSYTNIVNGLGLFASRASAAVMNYPLEAGNNSNNMRALANGIYTLDLNFCDPNPSDLEFHCN